MTCAREHIGYDVTVSVDISDWFAHVTLTQLVRLGYLQSVRKSAARRCGAPGLAHVAGVCESCGRGMDRRILAALDTCAAGPAVHSLCRRPGHVVEHVRV